MPGYQNYIFDLYGTLVDIRTDENAPRLWRQTARWYSAHGADYTPGELKEAYGLACEAEQASSPDPDYEIELRRVFRGLYSVKGIVPSAELTEDTAFFFRCFSLKKLRVYPWVRPVFARIRAAGAGIFLLSNAQACFTVPELRSLHLAEAFDGVVLSSDAGVRKPSVKIMEKLLRENDLDRKDCLMIGNDRRTDVAVARNAGMRSLFLRTETSGPEDGSLPADAELTDGDFAKLPGLLGL